MQGVRAHPSRQREEQPDPHRGRPAGRAAGQAGAAGACLPHGKPGWPALRPCSGSVAFPDTASDGRGVLAPQWFPHGGSNMQLRLRLRACVVCTGVGWHVSPVLQTKLQSPCRGRLISPCSACLIRNPSVVGGGCLAVHVSPRPSSACFSVRFPLTGELPLKEAVGRRACGLSCGRQRRGASEPLTVGGPAPDHRQTC